MTLANSPSKIPALAHQLTTPHEYVKKNASRVVTRRNGGPNAGPHVDSVGKNDWTCLDEAVGNEHRLDHQFSERDGAVHLKRKGNWCCGC